MRVCQNGVFRILSQSQLQKEEAAKTSPPFDTISLSFGKGGIHLVRSVDLVRKTHKSYSDFQANFSDGAGGMTDGIFDDTQKKFFSGNASLKNYFLSVETGGESFPDYFQGAFRSYLLGTLPEGYYSLEYFQRDPTEWFDSIQERLDETYGVFLRLRANLNDTDRFAQ